MSGDRWRQVVGWSEAVFGGLGLVLIPLAAVRNPSIQHPATYIAGAAILFGLSFVAGVLLLRRSPVGIPLSICVLIPQAVWGAAPSFQIKFISGLLAGVQFTNSSATVRLGFEVAAWVGPNLDAQPWLLVINVFPLLALRGLWKAEFAKPEPGMVVPAPQHPESVA